ncbi:MAG: hypothetical protein CMO05_11290 [Thalassospira sp.]|nr:hypothetical protein [Thalassospira sp.]
MQDIEDRHLKHRAAPLQIPPPIGDIEMVACEKTDSAPQNRLKDQIVKQKSPAHLNARGFVI